MILEENSWRRDKIRNQSLKKPLKFLEWVKNVNLLNGFKLVQKSENVKIKENENPIGRKNFTN